MFSFSYLASFFMFYAVAGWCIEVIYKTTCTGHFVNRGFLNGPLCPIYGFGVTAVILCLTPIQDNLLLLYPGSVVLTTALEYVTGLVLEKIFHQKWWDYSEEHFNIQGYVCLRFSLLWGIACVFVMRIIQPLVLLVCEKCPQTLQMIILLVFYVLLIADFIITVAALAKVGTQLKLANDLDRFLNGIAEAVGKRISGQTIKSMEDIEDGRQKLEKLKEVGTERLEHLQNRYESVVRSAKEKYGEEFTGKEKISFVHRRLEKAYPSLDFGRLERETIKKKLDSVKAGFEEFTENIGNMKL